MRADANRCACPECGVECTGRFDGCQEVWDRGPREVVARRLRSTSDDGAALLTLATTNGVSTNGRRATEVAEPVDAHSAVDLDHLVRAITQQGQELKRLEQMVGELTRSLAAVHAALDRQPAARIRGFLGSRRD